jgi:hypothetical protein
MRPKDMSFPTTWTCYLEKRRPGFPGAAWRAQFCVCGIGWFYGRGSTPHAAMRGAWRAWRRCPQRGKVVLCIGAY